MFFSRLSKLALILSLLASVSCQQSTTNNTSNSNTQPTQTTQATQPPNTTQGPPSTTSSATEPTPNSTPVPSGANKRAPDPSTLTQTTDPKVLNNPKPTPLTKEEILRKKQQLTNKGDLAGPPSTLQSQRTYSPAVAPDVLPKEQRDNKLANTKDISRAVIRYYNFLTDIRGLSLNLPKEMVGGASAFKAVDVLQFTLKNQPEDKPIAILVAEFNNQEDQAKGTGFMRKMGNSQRKSFQVKNYSLLVLGGDEKVHKILTDSLEQFR